MTNSHGQLMRSYINLLNEIKDYEFIDRAEDTPVPNDIKPALLEIANAFDNIQKLFAKSNEGKLNSRNYNPVAIFQTNIPNLAPEIISNIDKCISEYQKIDDFKIKNYEDPFFEEVLFRKVRHCVQELTKIKKTIDRYLAHLNNMKTRNLNTLKNEKERNLRIRLRSDRINHLFNFKAWNAQGEMIRDMNIQDTLRTVIGNKTTL